VIAAEQFMDRNHRQHTRVVGPFEGRMGIFETPVVLYDLSEGGCFINSLNDAPERGRRFVLHIDLTQTESVTLEAEVLDGRAGFGFAVRFLDPPPAVAERLRLEAVSRGARR
jgi:hypothetical protein